MKLYRIYNRIFTKWADEDIEANSALDACSKLGWLIDDCWVREQTFTRNEYGTAPNGWRNITTREDK